MTDAPRSSLTIIICTFNRHELLTRALDSIAALDQPEKLAVSVLVVDNSPDSNALPLVEKQSARFPFALTGIAARPANISVARNVGVAAATSEFIAFVDDDQEVEPDWLTEIEAVVLAFPHDVFFGSVVPKFEAPERADETLISTFSRTVDGPTGLDLFAIGKRKTRGVALGSGNSIFRRNTTLTDAQPFDLAFGNSGGEDTELFCRLQREGKRFGWAPLVRVHEYVPAARCEPDYLAERLFAGAQTFARSVSQNSPIPFLERLKQRAIGAIQLVLLLPQTLVSLSGSDANRTRLRYRRALALGKLTFAKPEPYRAEGVPHKPD